MLAVLTVDEMRAADAATLVQVPQSVLVRRAGTAVALAALDLLGGAYGRRVQVLAGKGNNGADGRVAGAVLSRRGAKVEVIEAASAPPSLGPCDLVIDAALGTGFRGSYDAPRLAQGTPVLAVDIPSGVTGDTGQAPGRPLAARRTVTFAAWKRGLLLGDGPELAGQVTVADIGVEPGPCDVGLVEDLDVATLVPRRPREAHKWMTAVAVVAGSVGMEGAAALSAAGAMRAGAGMVRLGIPGVDATAGPWPVEAVRLPLPAEGWADRVLEELGRCRALVVGPGLGRSAATGAQVRALLERTPVPTVVDADALFALQDGPWPLRAGRQLVLTPHDGEYARLAGAAPGPDRITAASELSARSGATVLLKGSLTAVAGPGTPRCLLAAAGSSRLATAGTGDVLSGVIGALLARGLDPTRAAALGAHVHGRAAALGLREGLASGDLPELVARWLSAQ